MTCLCLTASETVRDGKKYPRNQRHWLPKAIQCYQSQTYPNKELLIVADGEDVRDLIPNDPTIRLLHIEHGRRIGEKRNFGCGQAHGEIVAHWDDDDHSAPSRIADQVQRLIDSGMAFTGYCPMYFTDGQRWWKYVNSDASFALGTSFCYRKDWWAEHPFPALQVNEDGKFREVAKRANQITVAPAGLLMYATVHPGNTSPRCLDECNFKRVAQSPFPELVHA